LSEMGHETIGSAEPLQLQLGQSQDLTAFLFLQLQEATKQIEGLTRLLDEQSQRYEAQISALTEKVVVLTEQIVYFQNQIFGSRSEKTKTAATPSPAPRAAEESGDVADGSANGRDEAVGTRSKKPPVRSKGRKADRIKDIPAKEIIITLEDSQKNCPECGKALKNLGQKIVREVVEFQPAGLYRIVYVVQSSYCPCPEPDEAKIVVVPPVPVSPIQGSIAGPGLISHIFHMKFTLGVPVYRQIPELKRYGLDISRNTVSNWLVVAARDWLCPIYARLHRELASNDVLHADETPYQIINRSDGKPGTSEARIWLARTTWQADHPVIYYYAALTRSRADAEILLEGFSGYLVCDGYSAYRNMPGITVCACLAHIRRKFNDIAAVAGQGYAAAGVNHCDQIFHIESELKPLDPDKRKLQRLQRVKPLLDGFYEWLASFAPMKGKLQEAVNYALNLRDDMYRFLEDGRIQVSNNICEQLVKPVAIGRKNSLFSTSEDGAQACAMAHTLIESGKANGLDPEKYLAYIFSKLPNTDFRMKPELLENFLPWSDAIQQNCK